MEMKWKVVVGKKKEAELVDDMKKGKKEEKMTRKEKNDEISQAEQFRREETNRHANVDVIWHDVTIPAEKLASIKPFQKVNHFPSMCGVTKKDKLALSLKKMKNQYPIDFGFYPKTWVIPLQLSKLKSDLAKMKAKDGVAPFMIVKPAESC